MRGLLWGHDEPTLDEQVRAVEDGKREFRGTMPIRQEIEVLPATEPSKQRLGWTVYETIGQGIVNPNCFGSSPQDRELLRAEIHECDGGWALLEVRFEWMGCGMQHIRYEDRKILAFSHNRDDLVAIQWEAQTRLDRKFYAVDPPHLKVLDLERQVRKQSGRPMAPLEAMREEQVLMRMKPADWEWLRQEKLAKLADHGVADPITM